MSTVRMINSVADHVAGEEYELADDEADRFIIKGYAEGTLSRDYDEQEQQLLQADHQEVGV
jgi:hypothetical protein